MEYLHIDYQPPLRIWLPQVIARLNTSLSPTLRKRAASWSGGPLRENGLALATKLQILSLVISRLDHQLQRLGGLLTDKSTIEECIRREASYPIQDKMLPYELLADIDSFLFESRSAYEIVGHFLRQLFELILDRRIGEGELKQLLEARKIDTQWIDELREDRKLFFHRTAPWFKLEVVSRQPFRFELVILKRDVKNPTASEDYIRFEQLRAIYSGFELSLNALYQWIFEQIRELEEKEIEQEGSA